MNSVPEQDQIRENLNKLDIHKSIGHIEIQSRSEGVGQCLNYL